MSRITGVIVALATTAAVLTGSTSGAAPPPAAAAELPRELEGGVEVTLADGDLLRVTTAENYRTVWSERRDAATGTWGPRTVVLRRKNLFCGDVDARTANGAVALIAKCDRYSYSADQAPVASHALWSADTVTWSSYELEGEAYEEPGISDDGSNAIWPEHDGYVVRTEAGFTRHRLDTRGMEYTSTATITDQEQVTYLFGAQTGRRCALVVLTRNGAADPVRQEVSGTGACGDIALANVDQDTVWLGDLTDPAFRTVVARADPSSPWAVTQVAPAGAPGLQRAGRLGVGFFTATAMPLISLGAPDRRRFRAQRYDPVSQTWGPTVLAYDAGARRCRWGDNWIAEPLAVIAVDLKCGARHVVLTTTDGVAWQALPMGRHVRGISPDGRYVAVPGRSRTSVISAERGVVTLPLPVTGRCDVVVPDGPDGAVLLTSRGRHHGWPTVLQHSSPDGWSTLSRTDLPTFATPCTTARSSAYELPYRVDLFGRLTGYTVRILERDGEWTARRSRR